MRHIKEIKRADGSRVRVRVILSVEWNRGGALYRVEVETCAPRKRSWFSAVNHDDYEWRKLDYEGREREDMRRKLLHVSLEEIQEVALELWQMVRPAFTPR